MPDQQSLAVYAVLMKRVLVVGARKSRQVPSVSPDRKLPPPLANITLLTTQCDSKYPRCTACATAGTACEQEDRHRQTLTPRGHAERIERQLLQTVALLKRHIPGFDLNNLDEICAREGLEIDPNVAPLVGYQWQARAYPPLRPGDPMPPKGFPPYPPIPQPHMIPPGYPPMPMYGPPGSPYPPPPLGMQGPPGPYNPQIHPSFQHPPQVPPQPTPVHVQPRPSSADGELKGTDPNSNDLSNSQVSVLAQPTFEVYPDGMFLVYSRWPKFLAYHLLSSTT